MALQSKSHFPAGFLKTGPTAKKRTPTSEWGNWRGQAMCKTKLCIADNLATWWAAGHSTQVSQWWSSPLRLIRTDLPASPPAAASDVFSPPHCLVLTSGARCWSVGSQCQVRGELPGRMQRGAVRRDAAVRTHRPGRLRLLPGLRGRQRGALLPHGVRHARGEVRTGIILRVLQGWGRLWRRIRHLQRCVQNPDVHFRAQGWL